MRVHGLHHSDKSGQIAVVPKPTLGIGREVARRVDFHFLRRHNGPAALRLDAPHGGQGLRIKVAHAVAVRNLVETVLGHYGPDGNGLKENVIAGVARHFDVSDVSLGSDGLIPPLYQRPDSGLMSPRSSRIGKLSRIFASTPASI